MNKPSPFADDSLFNLAVGLSRAALPPLYWPGDRVTEGRDHTVLTVVSCEAGHVRAERKVRLPDGTMAFSYGVSALACHFTLFARAGDDRPEPTPKPSRPLTAVERLELSHDGRIPQRDLDAARRVDAEAAAALFAQDGERPMMRAAE